MKRKNFMLYGNKEGSIVLLAAILMSTLMALLLFTSAIIETSQEIRQEELYFHGIAINMAQAGIVDCLSWFRRNAVEQRNPTTGRVFNFYDYCTNEECGESYINDPQVPAYTKKCSICGSPLYTPDSINPAIGLVNEINFSSNIYGRYEIWDSDIEDISEKKSINSAGTGAIWYIEVVGIAYRKFDPNAKFHYCLLDDSRRKKVELLSSVVMATEFRRVTINLPTEALVISADRAKWVKLGSKCRLIGPGTTCFGVSYKKGTGSIINNGCDYEGFTSLTSSVDPESYDTSVKGIFSVEKEELKEMADIVADSIDDLPDSLPEMSLVYIEGNITFTTSHPLKGSGVLFVDGDLHLAGQGHSFSGVICTTGKFFNNAVTTFYGAIVAGIEEEGSGIKIDINGIGADYAEFYYDPDIIEEVRTQIGVYRIARTPYIVMDYKTIGDRVIEIQRSWLYGNKNISTRLSLPEEP